jgi:hypothetical protein
MVYIIYVFEYLMAPRPPPPLPPPPPLQALPLPHAAAVMSVPSHPQPPGVWDHPIPRPWSSSCTHRRCSVSRASRSPGGRQPPDPAAPAPTVDGSEPSAASHGRCMACRRGNTSVLLCHREGSVGTSTMCVATQSRSRVPPGPAPITAGAAQVASAPASSEGVAPWSPSSLACASQAIVDDKVVLTPPPP